MLAAVSLLLAGGAAVGIVPGMAQRAGRAAAMFLDRGGYLAQTLTGAAGRTPAAPHALGWTPTGVLLGLASAAAAAGVAGLQLRGGAPLGGLRVLRRLHSGHVGDYVAWLFAGVAALAVLIGLPLL